MTSSESRLSPDGRTVEIQVEAASGVERHLEPVTCGIPWPRGVLAKASRLVLQNHEGNPVPLQARVLDRWADGSVRWALLDWQADARDAASYRVDPALSGEAPAPTPAAARAILEDGTATVDTGAAQFRLRRGGAFPFTSVVVGGAPSVDPDRSGFTIEDEAGRLYRPRLDQLRLEDAGPVRVSLRLEGELVGAGVKPLGEFAAQLHFFAGSATVRFDVTLRNPRRAAHRGGLWDLGDKGSIYLRDAALRLALPEGSDPTVLRCSAECGAPLEVGGEALELYQDSSGGANWRSANHMNRHRVVPNSFRGYRLRLDGAERTGQRATPVVVAERGSRTLAVAVQHFWQNFPKAVEASPHGIVLRLFPRQYADVHELQGGEQKTHTFHVAFGRDTVTEIPLDWCRAPLLARATPDWYCSTGVIPYLTPRASDLNHEYLRLVDAAVEGNNTFDHKREVIDEYGWRHFGDIYADHEAVFHKEPVPLASHYNNQYDAVAGFAYQFLRSGDARWRRHMDELAAHVLDIDIYHTDRDKSAYNHGLFWHTFHYTDADTSTHRSYPRAGKTCGGGPSNEHNYATGLMLHYFLTGRPDAREAAIRRARWVIDVDDGRKTVFRWLDRGPTGWASSTRSPRDHGPGRGAGNSIAVLLAGHQLSGDAAFLTKAEQLLRRCIHPADNVDARNLLDAENHWSYTVFLQSLGRYLDYKAGWGQLDRMYAYGRACLLRYARWMAEHEYPYLDKPEILEYPNETWAAQDMRKSEVFQYAARHAAGAEKARFRERAEFFFRYSVTTLAHVETRALARPVVLLLSNGFAHAFFQQHPESAAPEAPEGADGFGAPEIFVPQKVRAKKRFLLLTAGVVLALFFFALYLLMV